MFKEQAMRLIRESWSSVKMLAEELYTIFQTEGELTHKGTIVIEPNGDAPPFQLRGFSDGSAVFKFTGPDGTDLGSITFSGGSFSSSTTTTSTTNPDSSSLTVYPGKVVSGSGASYVVTIYANGPDGTGTNVNATQLSINASATIPAETWTLVLKIGSNYYMQVPVWL